MKKSRKIPTTAAEAADDFWWDEDYQLRLLGGTVQWDCAGHTSRGKLIRIMRLDTKQVRAFRQYVKPDTKVQLVRK